jgi:uncharacterized protein YkwD
MQRMNHGCQLKFLLGLGLLFAGCSEVAGQNYQPGFLSGLESNIVSELNLARTNPHEYAGYLEQYRQQYSGNQVKHAFGRVETVEEGVAAIDEAIQYLRSQAPLQPLREVEGMRLAARDLGREQSSNGATGHQGRDGSLVDDRVNRYGTWKTQVGECLSYGRDDARIVVMSLIIDDGRRDREHRKEIFAASFGVVGVYCDTHPDYNVLAVITLAGDFVAKTSRGHE